MTTVVTQEKSMALETVSHLFYALNQAGVRYCHWKSNVRLEQALDGQTDLDLLVAPEHKHTFRRILSEHQVKALVAAPGKAYPDVENHLGFDPRSGRLFHLHVHYQLVLGEQFVKNYHVPLEVHFLNSVRMCQGVPIPAPEWELIVLSLRALLKYRDRDAIKDVLSVRAPGLPAHIRQEIEWLWAQTSIERIKQALQDAAQVVPGEVVLAFLKTVLTSPRDGRQLYRLRAGARRGLHRYQRRNRLHASLTYFQELWRRHSFLKTSPNRKMTLPDGGRTLALIGADGAGKSTMCKLLADWLAWKVDVHRYYLGSKQPSRGSELLYTLFRASRRGHRSIGRLLGEQSVPAKFLATLRQALLYSHYLSLGIDRYRRYRVSQGQATADSLVIYDRYPLEAPLDGPKIHLAANGDTGRLARIFATIEQSIYRQIGLPDYFFLLNARPDVSLQRKPEHDRAAIEAKSRFLSNWAAQIEQESGSSSLFCIDANRPFEEVVNQLKAAVWQVL